MKQDDIDDGRREGLDTGERTELVQSFRTRSSPSIWSTSQLRVVKLSLNLPEVVQQVIDQIVSRGVPLSCFGEVTTYRQVHGAVSDGENEGCDSLRISGREHPRSLGGLNCRYQVGSGGGGFLGEFR